MLQYNKLYQSLKKVSAEWHAGHVQWQFVFDYLRFYEDGTVLFACSPDKKEDVDQWLRKEIQKEYTGKFKLSNINKLEITIPVAIGTIIFEGILQHNNIILRKKNPKIHHSSWDFFSLV